jgi:hypothetical protein
MKIEKLPQLPWFEPPAPQGLGHGGGPGYSEDGLSNAELGEIVEIALIEQMGFVSALGPGLVPPRPQVVVVRGMALRVITCPQGPSSRDT